MPRSRFRSRWAAESATLDASAGVLAPAADRVILGTAAVERPGAARRACGRFPGRIAVGIDARDGKRRGERLD